MEPSSKRNQRGCPTRVEKKVKERKGDIAHWSADRKEKDLWP